MGEVLSKKEIDGLLDALNNIESPSKEEIKNDNVNHPKHYTSGKIEVIDFILDQKLGFCLGNVVKYVARSGKKDPSKEIEDLRKANWYLNKRIEELQGQK